MTAGKVRANLPGSINLNSPIEWDRFGPRAYIDNSGFVVATIRLGNAHLQIYSADQACKLAAVLLELGGQLAALEAGAPGPSEITGGALDEIESIGDAP